MLRRGNRWLILLIPVTLVATSLYGQTRAATPTPSARPRKKPATSSDSALDDGAVINRVYHNKSLLLTCKIPEAWVLRTDEMNARDEDNGEDTKEEKANATAAQLSPASSAGAKVLLAAFSRPPEAKGEDVNSSILIAAENAAAYPGLTEAAQYFGPLTEVAKAQGFTPDEDPYELALGPKTLVRADFHKNVGSRVIHQSTLAMLTHGYAVSITLLAGTEDEVEELVDSLTFTAPIVMGGCVGPDCGF
jgi:hypothetical protein